MKVCLSGRILRETKENVEATPNKVDASSSSSSSEELTQEDLNKMTTELEKILDDNGKVQLKGLLTEIESAKNDEEKLEGVVSVNFFFFF